MSTAVRRNTGMTAMLRASRSLKNARHLCQSCDAVDLTVDPESPIRICSQCEQVQKAKAQKRKRKGGA